MNCFYCGEKMKYVRMFTPMEQYHRVSKIGNWVDYDFQENIDICRPMDVECPNCDAILFHDDDDMEYFVLNDWELIGDYSP